MIGAAITVLILTVALVAPLVYVAFYAPSFDFFQKVVVVLVSLILGVAAVAVMWIVWAGRRGFMRSWSHRHNP
jgi:H+/Cl- antiporter ClcA